MKNNSGNLKKYYAIEPDGYVYRMLEENLEEKYKGIRDKIVPVCAAAYDTTKDMVPFFSLRSPGSFVTPIGNCKVNTIRIDDMIDDSECTFIKMNIEGSEMKALKGGEKTIQEKMPVLAIMGYHKTSDLWEIPQMILSINPDYKLYMRSYMNHVSFMYYAVPKDRIAKQ